MGKVQAVSQTFTTSQSINPDGFTGWMCVNIGSAVANVMGYPLAPGEGLNFLDVQDEWLTPISIELSLTAVVRMTRLKPVGKK